jgi:hypothetical protein
MDYLFGEGPFQRLPQEPRGWICPSSSDGLATDAKLLVIIPGVGGPTMMTTQRLGGALADRGWVVHPRTNRLVVFDANFLHGVLPGKISWHGLGDKH